MLASNVEAIIDSNRRKPPNDKKKYARWIIWFVSGITVAFVVGGSVYIIRTIASTSDDTVVYARPDGTLLATCEPLRNDCQKGLQCFHGRCRSAYDAECCQERWDVCQPSECELSSNRCIGANHGAACDGNADCHGNLCRNGVCLSSDGPCDGDDACLSLCASAACASPSGMWESIAATICSAKRKSARRTTDTASKESCSIAAMTIPIACL